jgi:DNA-binding NarL/FixJ family response regulator
MEVVLYAHDLDLLETLQQSLQNTEYTLIDEIERCRDSIVVCALDEDVRSNETIVRPLVSAGNRVLLLQRVPSIEPARYYLSLGVRGYGNTMMDSLFLLSAIEALQIDMMWLHPEITAKMVEMLTPKYDNKAFLERLSEREQEIALHLLEGKTYNAIADYARITPRTVKAHAARIYQKLQVKDRLDFALQYK